MMTVARRTRVHFEGAIYHVIARGNNRAAIFHDEEDKGKYLSLVQRYKLKFAFTLLAYVLMDNHVHLLIAVSEAPLAKPMQGIQQSYTQYYNHKYQHVGHIFQQRYKARLCHKDEYLLTLIRYIHRNALKGGLTESIDYRWSSHKDYLKGYSTLVDVKLALQYFADNTEQAIACYRHFMFTEDKDDEDGLRQVYYDFNDSENLTNVSPQTSWSQLVEAVCSQQNISEELLASGRRLHDVVVVRQIIIYLASRLQIASGQEIAERLGINAAQVTRGFKKVFENQVLRNTADKIMEKMSIMQQRKA